ncbi:hypothetical protein [Spiroplasma sp. DGKH1]|uniref:hypothetical protein n=1 Tax=Spiroplasma sp. DGKH1 TaxID=3050074 RepID=UPI0034C6B7A6
MEYFQIEDKFYDLIINKKKTIEIRKQKSLSKVIRFSYNQNLGFAIPLINLNGQDCLGILKFSGFLEIKKVDLIHFYENTNKDEWKENECQCSICCEIYWKFDMAINRHWIIDNWDWIIKYLEAEDRFIVYFISSLQQTNQVRCLNDNKLLFKQFNKSIEIKCGKCKKIHILTLDKKN